MEKVVLELPEPLAEEARKQGLLTSEALREWLEGALKKHRTDTFFDAADRLTDLRALSAAELEREIIRARQGR